MIPTPLKQHDVAVSYKQFTEQRNAAFARSRPLSGTSRMAQVGSSVVEDHLGHARFIPEPPVQQQAQASNHTDTGDGVIEYDDALQSMIPTQLDIDYSKYGL